MRGFWRSQHGFWLPLRTAGGRHDRVAALLDYLPQRLVWDAVLVLLFAVGAAQAVVEHDGAVMLSGTALVVLALMARTIPKAADEALPEGLMWLIWWAEVVVWGTIADTVFRVILPTPTTNLALNALFVAEWVVYVYLIVDLVGPPRERKRVRVPSFVPRLSPSPV